MIILKSLFSSVRLLYTHYIYIYTRYVIHSNSHAQETATFQVELRCGCKVIVKRMACCSRPKHNGVADLAGRDAEAVIQGTIPSLHLLYRTGKLKETYIHTHQISEQ
jgi:hypothetical protein